MASLLIRPFLLSATVLLAACQTMAPRTAAAPSNPEPSLTKRAEVNANTEPDTSPDADPASEPENPETSVRTNISPVSDAEHPTRPNIAAENADVWQRLRDSFELPGCDYAPDAIRWARRYAASPTRFASVLDQMLPALDYTQRRMEEADLPGEFALLPIVESHFRPHPGKIGQPAGIWQMVGPTARSAGVRIDPWFDGRLNLIESTEGAIALLDRYGDHFNSDWRLVAFAYNAGEYRIKRALERHQPGEDFASLKPLGIAKTSYEYLTKLLALSCLIREPERFDLQLPDLAPERTLAEIELDGVVSASLARALSGLSRTDFERVNAGMLRGRTPPDERPSLLVAAVSADQLETTLSQIPPARRLEWQQRRLRESESLEDIAERNGLLLETLLALNQRDSTDDIAPGTTVWLPGRVTSATSTRPQGQIQAADGIHVVQRGDSLWTIARRYGLTVAELLRYNRLDNERLMPGQQLRLTSP